MAESTSFRRWSEQPNYRNTQHAQKIFDMLGTLRSSNQLCDITLIAGSDPDERTEADSAGAELLEINAHRTVLAASCSYFYAMLTGEMTESRQSRIYIQGVNPKALGLLIDYMYSAEIHITEDNVQILLPAANLLQMSEVRQACCEFLKAQIHPSNCLGIRSFADLHSCSELLSYANSFTEQHFSDLTQCEEFLSLTKDEVLDLIGSDRLTVASEELVFEAVVGWVHHDVDRRRDDLPRLMEYVRLPLLSQEYLLDKVDSEPLIRESPQCKDFLIEALKYHLLKAEQKSIFKSPRVRPRIPIGLPKIMIVIGGQAPKAIRNVDVYDFQTEKWYPVADLPQRRCRCGVAVLGGLVYAVGGFNGSLRVRTVDVYDPSRDIWSPAPSMEARRSTLGVAVMNGMIYAVGGFDGSSGLNSIESFDPRMNEWKLLASMSTRRSSVGVGVVSGMLYAVGGYDGLSRQCLSSVERYDPTLDQWANVAEMTTRRSGAGVGVIEGKLYAVGGHDGPLVKKSAEVYDPEAESWRAISDMSLCRRNAGVISLNGLLYAVGGDDGSSNLVSVEVYNPKSDSWSMLPSCMSIGRSYAGVAVINKLIHGAASAPSATASSATVPATTPPAPVEVATTETRSSRS